MLTERQAQDLLRQAGDTIDVDPAGPLDTSLAPRRRWPVLAAAAAVLLVAGGLAVGLGQDRDSQDDSAPPTDASATPALDMTDKAFQFGPDQMPSVFGMTERDARTVLEQRGLTVTVEPAPRCDDPDRAVRTTPTAGALIAPGDTVTLFVADTSVFRCISLNSGRSAALALLDAARGQGPIPPTAPGVDLTPVLTYLRASTASRVSLFADPTEPARDSDLVYTSSIGARPGCSSSEPTVEGRWLTLSLDVPLDTSEVGIQLCRAVAVHYSGEVGDSAVDRVNLGLVSDEEPPGPPDVVGNSPAFATARLEAQGFVVRAEARSDCRPPGLVSYQYPYPASKAQPGDIVTIRFTDEPGPCVDDFPSTIPPEAQARQLVKFAHGLNPPTFADSLRIYVNDDLRATLTGDDRARRAAWSVDCNDGYCLPPPSILDLLGRPRTPLVRSSAVSTCPAHPAPGPLTSGLDTTGLTVTTLSDRVSDCTRGFAVELYLEDSGELAAVNLLLGSDFASRADLTVPAVIGLTREQATAEVSLAGLEVHYATDNCGKGAPHGPGTVYDQAPRAGERAISGSVVTLMLSAAADCDPD